MLEYKLILCSTFTPEIAFFLCLPFKESRSWWFRMIEDSDGDPHHTDGLFIILLFAALWCFRIGIIAGLRTIYYGTDLLQVCIAFLTTGCALLGVRVALLRHKKISLTDQRETKYE